MPDAFDFAMTEHAAWRSADGRIERVFVLPNGARWLATVRECTLRLDALGGQSAVPAPGVFTLPGGAPANVSELAAALGGLGSVARFRNFDLWDAIGTAIIRQVIRAAHAKKLYRAFCDAYGERVRLPSGDVYCLFPTPEIAFGLDSDQFSAIGMAFKRPPLLAAAQAYLEHGAKWRDLPPTVLIGELQTVPRIGQWTAHAAVADWSNDWSLYPYADLAVRTWAKRAAPAFTWPDDEPTFGALWRALACEHLSSLTLLTLAWGSQHGDTG
jgi:DNA-3-methyladenine glycosylase II